MAATLVLGIALSHLPFAVFGVRAGSDSSRSSGAFIISTSAALTADFSFSPTHPLTADGVLFSGNATGGVPPYSYSWDFKDGSIGTGATVNHSFASPGLYLVLLTVRDFLAINTTTASHSVTVAAPPSPDFTFSPNRPVVGEPVTFSGSSSNGGFLPYTFSWTFGDGASGSGSPITHSFFPSGSLPRSYSVSLSIVDSAGHHGGPVSKPITITAVLIADFSFSPLQPAVNESVAFKGIPSGGTPSYLFTWSFGDSTVGTGQNQSHAYRSAGTFTVTLTIRDNAGHTATASKSVPVATDLTANFTLSQTKPAVNEMITFTAEALGGTPGYSYSWNFGDGTPGKTGQIVTHSFSVAQTFTITLTVTDSSSRVAVFSHPVPVTPVLSAEFTFSPSAPAVNEYVSFSAVNVTGGTPGYTYLWTFGDGGNGAGVTSRHAYSTAAIYYVTLTVSDSAAHSTPVTKSISVASGLAVSFTFLPARPVTNETISFSASASGGTPQYVYRWDFGDASTGSGASPTHSYALARSFLTTLNVSDSGGRSAGSFQQILVAWQLSGNFSYSPRLPLIAEQITFTANASGAYPPYAYLWDFADGSTATGPVVNHAYPSPGSYNVSVRMSDKPGHAIYAMSTVAVARNLAAGFTASKTFPVVDEVVKFSAEARGANPPYTFDWDFGDGAKATGANVSHAYLSSMAFTVTLTAHDSVGNSNIVTKSIVVTAVLFADLIFYPGLPIAGQTVLFTGLPTGGTPPYGYLWTFGDGANKTGASVVHAYGKPGNYSVKLSVLDFASHNATKSNQITISASFIANFTLSPTNPVAGQVVSFNAFASGGTTPYIFDWDFGDHATNGGMNVSHTYTSSGAFTVTLTATDSAGHQIRVPRTLAIGPSVLASFTYSPSRPLMGHVVAFVANASGGEAPYTYQWIFGDGKTAQGAETTHTFGGVGVVLDRDVTLTVCDHANRCASIVRTLRIENVFSLAIVAEAAIGALVVGYWILERRRRPQGVEGLDAEE